MDRLIDDIDWLRRLIVSAQSEALTPLRFFSEALEITYKIEKALVSLEAEQIEHRQREITSQRASPVPEPAVTDVLPPNAPERVEPKPPLSAVLAKEESTDVRKLLSLNDRFRFQRELFGGDSKLFNRVLDVLSAMVSYAAATDYIRSQMNWSEEEEITKEFYSVLERFYSA